jgi:hypothetical protein
MQRDIPLIQWFDNKRSGQVAESDINIVKKNEDGGGRDQERDNNELRGQLSNWRQVSNWEQHIFLVQN